MMKVKGHIDSMNFSGTHLEDYFTSKAFIVEVVKSRGIFEPHRWLEEFGKPLTRNIVEAKILHTQTGLTLPLKRFSTSQNKQTLEFAGLKGYREKSNLLMELLNNLWVDIQNKIITRIDVAIDFKGKVPTKVIKTLSKSRIPFKYYNTTYSKTASEKKTNPHLDIKIYNKALHAHLDYELERLEFCFKGSYFRGKYKVEDMNSISKKMKKTIKRMCGLDIEIEHIKN